MFGLTLWPVIKPYLEKYHDDPDWIEACRIRFQEGEQIHGVGNWLNWTEEDFDINIREEALDFDIYGAMRDSIYGPPEEDS